MSKVKIIGIRNGDISLEPVKELPKGLKEKDNVLALGEITGHQHVLKGEAKVMIDNNGRQFCDVEQATLVHEEHNTLTVQKGCYRVVRARELDLAGKVRQVMD